MSNKVYDILKWITAPVLPALATLYLAISAIWGLPFGEQIAGTIMAVDTFLGTILGISNKKYKEKMKEVANEVERDSSES